MKSADTERPPQQQPADNVDLYRDSRKGDQLTTDSWNSRYRDEIECCERGDIGHINYHKSRRRLLSLSFGFVIFLGVFIIGSFAYSCTFVSTLGFSGNTAGVVKRAFGDTQNDDPFIDHGFIVIVIIIPLFLILAAILAVMYRRGNACFRGRQPMVTYTPVAIASAGDAPGYTGDTAGFAGDTPGPPGDSYGFSGGGDGGGGGDSSGFSGGGGDSSGFSGGGGDSSGFSGGGGGGGDSSGSSGGGGGGGGGM